MNYAVLVLPPKRPCRVADIALAMDTGWSTKKRGEQHPLSAPGKGRVTRNGGKAVNRPPGTAAAPVRCALPTLQWYSDRCPRQFHRYPVEASCDESCGSHSCCTASAGPWPTRAATVARGGTKIPRQLPVHGRQLHGKNRSPTNQQTKTEQQQDKACHRPPGRPWSLTAALIGTAFCAAGGIEHLSSGHKSGYNVHAFLLYHGWLPIFFIAPTRLLVAKVRRIGRILQRIFRGLVDTQGQDQQANNQCCHEQSSGFHTFSPCWGCDNPCGWIKR